MSDKNTNKIKGNKMECINILREMLSGKNFFYTGWSEHSKFEYVCLGEMDDKFTLYIKIKGEEKLVDDATIIDDAIYYCDQDGEWLQYGTNKLIIDDPVTVWQEVEGIVKHRHFAGFTNDKKIIVYENGKKSSETDLYEIYDSWDAPFLYDQNENVEE